MDKYDDIINLPHHTSKTHPQMSNYNRAAQFAPFAALVGYAEAIKESEEKYDFKAELSEDKKEEIEALLQVIAFKIKLEPTIDVLYFVKQKENNIGKYCRYKGQVKKIDLNTNKIIFINKKSIYIKDIYDIKVLDE